MLVTDVRQVERLLQGYFPDHAELHHSHSPHTTADDTVKIDIRILHEAMVVAASNGHPHCLECLLRACGAGADVVPVMSTDVYALVPVADQDGDVSLPFTTPMHAACCSGSVACVRQFLSFGAHVNQSCRRLSAGEDMPSVLFVAAQEGQVEVVRLLLNVKADADVELTASAPMSPLFAAAKVRL